MRTRNEIDELINNFEHEVARLQTQLSHAEGRLEDLEGIRENMQEDQIAG